MTMQTTDGPQLLPVAPVRILSQITGVTLLMAALGMWLVPGSAWDAELLLIKLGLSLFLLVAGFLFVLPKRTPAKPRG